MIRTTFTNSNFKFNQRVLSLGHVESNQRLSMDDLKKKLFFNKIFISNINELFMKHNTRDIINDYANALNRYTNNIFAIKTIMRNCYDVVMHEQFTGFDERLVLEESIRNQLITIYYPSIEHVNYQYIHGVIYYVTILKNGYIGLSFIDPRNPIYKSPVKGDDKMYWKVDNAIIRYLNRKNKVDTTVAFIVTRHTDTSKITKVEFNGELHGDIKPLLSLFPSTSLIIKNAYIYTDDYEQLLNEYTASDSLYVPQLKKVGYEHIFEKDMLSEYPRDSFDSYLQFLYSVINSGQVKRIYMTLYRIGKDPLIYYMLRDAVKQGIQVFVNIELCASGEIINQLWADEMKALGINVTHYKSGEIKVHSKLTLIVFKNGLMISNIGTGNYHTQTTTQYTDLSLTTAKIDICKQVRNVFEIMLGNDPGKFKDNFLVTKYNARDQLIKLIEHEASLGANGYICIKCNSLDDGVIINHIDRASSTGCKIDLIIRGVCTYVPDRIGDNVIIKSIVWDKLEHSRIYCFGKENPILYIGSLDLVNSKIDKRLETLVRIDDPDIREKVCNNLNEYVVNTKNSWLLTRSGQYVKGE